MTQARVLFGDVPRMTAEIVESAIAGQEDIVAVGRATDAELGVAISQNHANVVIIGDRALAESVHLRLFAIHPNVKVMAITSGGDARLYELRTFYVVDPSPTTLLGLIRKALRV